MKQLNPLTGLRGVAAYSVLIAHSISTSFLYSGVSPFAAFSSRLAYFGMSLFFVLSGFVIHYNYAKLLTSEGYLSGGYKFIVARIARLYPLYALMLFFTLDCLPSTIFHNKEWAELSFITMTQSWFNLQMLTFPPAWSISTEWFFYFAFIFMLPLFERIKKPLLVMGIFLIGMFLLMPYYIQLQGILYTKVDGWTTYFSPFTRIFDFIGGILASKAYLMMQDNDKKASPLNSAFILSLIAGCIYIIAFDPFSATKYSVLISNFVFTPFIAPLLYMLCKYDSITSRALCSKALMFMGEISYSVYLLGFMIMTGLGAAYVNPKATPMAYINSSFKVFVIMTFTTFIAYGCFNLFEKPARNWVKRMLTSNSKKNLDAVCEIPIGNVLQQ
jgi:peptidoglycan/LPS O-acetylase OafA/YrhL